MKKDQWILDTRGDPLGTVNTFLQAVWNSIGLQGMILASRSRNELQIINDYSDLDEINPFQPLMLMNIAGLVPKVLAENPEGIYGILLRPCELRALHEVNKRMEMDSKRLVTICVDCLGTFPDDEFEWRSTRKGSAGGLTREALQFAPQGGIAAYRYRAACQMCTAPGARNGDINLGVLGIPVRQVIIIDGEQELFKWNELTDRPAEKSLTEKREVLLAKMIERHSQTKDRVLTGLVEVLPDNIDNLLDQFDNCGNCQECIDSCPICQTSAPRRMDSGRFHKQDVMDWLVDCAGCGMCEQSCPRHMPLSIIFTHIKKSLEETPVL
ncbi:hypothetical protein ACFLTX_00225 [Chloroflexota bacterium]